MTSGVPRYHAGIAFIMISITLCGLDQLCWRQWSLYPYKCWIVADRATLEAAEEVWNDPFCLKDAWTRWFLSQFKDPQAVEC